MEQILAALVPQITKDFATMSQHAPAERVQTTTVERDQPGDEFPQQYIDMVALWLVPLAASSSDLGTHCGSRQDLSSDAHLGAYRREDC